MRSEINDINGHPYVPLSATTRIGAGEVLYVGTVVWVTGAPVDPAPRPKIRDDRAAAAKWISSNLPAVAGNMQTRLLPPPVDKMN